MSHFIVGITGASGTIYASRLLLHLKNLGHRVSVIFSDAAKEVVAFEKQGKAFDLADEIVEKLDIVCEEYLKKH